MNIFCFLYQCRISSGYSNECPKSEDGAKEGFLISDDLSPHLYWYVLNSKVCGMTPTQYFKRSPVVSSFPDDFVRIESGNIRLAAGGLYTNKRSSNGTEIVCSSFGLISVLLRQKHSSECCEFSALLREFLNKLDSNVVCADENKVSSERSRASRRLEMSFTPPNKSLKTSSSMVMTPPNSVPKGAFSVSPNLKEISENTDLDTPEKVLLMKQRSGRVIKDVHDVCEKNRESLVVVLSNMCAFGDPEAKVLVNEIFEEVAVKKGVKRSVEELVGDDTLLKYVQSLRVPDWKLVLFQAMARVSAKTWQTVINITGLGRTGVRNLVK